MTQLDQRFKKNELHPTPLDAPRTMTLLLQEAEKLGLVRLAGPPDNPFVSLTKQDQGVSTPQAVAEAPQGTQVDFQRESDRFLYILRKADLGPFQQVRWAIYDEIEAQLEQPGSTTVGALLENSVSKVRADVEEARGEGRDYLVHHDSPNLPWSQVRGFIGLLFTRTPVLLGAEGSIRADWAHLDVRVDGIVESWRQVLDAQLAVHLLREGCTINQYTEVDFSGALYNSRLKRDHAQALLHYLLASHICEWTNDYSSLRLTAA